MWQTKENSLYKEFTFKDFDQAFDFMEQVAGIAKSMNHHPTWTNSYNKVQIWLNTHSANNSITEKDKKLATDIDKVFKKISMNKPELTYMKIYTDGGSRGNPGPAASGYVLMDSKDKVILKKGVYLGVTTNNQAEYRALLFAVNEAASRGVKEIDVYMDSLLIVNQLKGLYKVKKQELMPIYQDIKKQLLTFDKVSIRHIPRSLNSLADSAVNEALDKAIG